MMKKIYFSLTQGYAGRIVAKPTVETLFTAYGWRLSIILLCFFGINFGVLAQTKSVSGKVTSLTDGAPLPGVNILVKGTAKGTTTDAFGVYRVELEQDNAILIFSFIGYKTQEIATANQSVIDLKLADDINQLGEVVVTALGIERQTKALGYSVQDVKGAQLTQARETNLVNSLSGKIAGIQVTGASGAPGASSRILIRGASSVGKNNQPLFVVDGIPIDNGNYNSSATVDYGNGAASAVNPDDIASVSVLKGPNASALYGSRAANGVVLITTKSGKGSKGIGISVNSNTTFDSPLRLPDYQNSYAQGQAGKFSYKDGKGGGVNDGADESWGPKMDGSLVPQFDSPVDANGVRTPTPLVAHPDNWKNFFNTGTTLNNNVAITGGSEKADFRLSYTNLKQTGILPNTDYKRNTIALNAGVQLTSKLKARVSANYIKDGSTNRNNWGLYSIWFGRQVDIAGLTNYKKADGTQYNWNSNYWNNPYFVVYENTNANTRDRLIGNVMLNYQFTDWLSLMVRTGTDVYFDRRQTKIATFDVNTPKGRYREDEIYVEERNSDFLLTFNKKVMADFTLTASAGGNIRQSSYQGDFADAPQLAIPNVFTLANSLPRPVVTTETTKKQVNSLYGTAQLSFRDYLFLDITARNDWSSTLPPDKRSYFYPSASLSAVLTDAFNIQSDVLSFAKVRASLAKVGNDTDPYNLSQIYKFESPWSGTTTSPTVSESNLIYNPNLKPEISTSWEVGADVRFLNNRISLDVTYYEKLSENQILNVNVSTASGFQSKLLNAGKMTNKGVELQLQATVLKMENGFQWDLGVNYARNRNKVVELADGLTTYQLGSVRGMSIEARVGEAYGTFFGTAFLRDPNGNVVFSNGLPQLDPQRRILGNFTPNWTGGVFTTVSYKGLSLSALVDTKQGGSIFSQSVNIGRYTGVLAETAAGREEGIIGTGVKNVGTAAAPEYVVNDVRLPADQFTHGFYGLSNNEGTIFDATYVKLREMKLGYQFPDKLFGKTPFRSVNFSVVGRNLLILSSNVPHVDPESTNFGLNGNADINPNLQGIENGQLPSTRSIGFNLSFSL